MAQTTDNQLTQRTLSGNSLINALRWVDRNILSRETRFRWLDVLYMAFALVMLLNHVYIALIYPAWSYSYFGDAWIVFAIVSILLGKMWQDTGARILYLIWGICFLRVAIFLPDQLDAARLPLTTGLYAVGGAYSVLHVLKEKDRKLFLQLFCIGWTLYAGTLSVLAIYSAYTGITIYNLSTGTIEVTVYQRMNILYWINTAGCILSGSALVALWAATLFHSKWAKIPFLLAAAAMIMANALTTTRTGYVIIAVGTACFVCVWLNQHTPINLRQGTRSRKIGCGALLLLCFGVVIVGLSCAQTFLVGGFVSIRDRGGLLLSHAWAEEVEEVAPRALRMGHDFTSIDDPNALTSGRVTVWQAVLNDLFSSRRIMLMGRSFVDTMAGVQETIKIDHCHSLLLQTALVGGLPLVAIVLFFAGWLLKRHGRTLRNMSLASWQWMVIAIPLAIFIGELAEVTTIWEHGHPPLTLLYFFCGVVSVQGRHEKLKKRKV